MRFEAFYRLVKRNAKNEVVMDSGLVPCDSFVLQFLKLIRCEMVYPDSMKAKDIANTDQWIYVYGQGVSYLGRVDAGIGADTYGVVVGTNAGNTPEDNANYKLDTQILHSATGEAGKMNHQAVVMVAPSVVGGNVDMTVSRPFINETSGVITVKEIGIYCRQTFDTHSHCLLRDVVTPQGVNPAETLSVTYTLRTTV